MPIEPDPRGSLDPRNLPPAEDTSLVGPDTSKSSDHPQLGDLKGADPASVQASAALGNPVTLATMKPEERPESASSPAANHRP